MGYPREYVGRYSWVASWLKAQGHAVYPMEMHCRPILVQDEKPSFFYKNGTPHYEQHYLYGFVDLVSLFEGKIWAWEYKSRNDSVKRGLLQLRNYAKSFDYVCLIAEKPPINQLYEDFLALGAGVYHELKGAIFECLDRPELQNPDRNLHDKLLARFNRYVFPNVYAKVQRSLQVQQERDRFQKKHKLLTEF